MRAVVRYGVASVAILAAGLFFLASAEDERGVPLIDWIRDPEDSRLRHELRLAEQRAATRDLEEYLSGSSSPKRIGKVRTPATGREGALDGRALRLDGTPVAGLVVSAARPESGIATTDATGRFELIEVSPRAEVEVDPRAWLLLASGTQPVAGGGEELVLVVVESTALSGRVTDSTGVPLADALVVAFAPVAPAASDQIQIDLPTRLEQRVLSDAEGRFELVDLPRVSFLRVDVSKSGYVPLRSGPPDDPDAEFELALEPLGDEGGR